MKTLSSLFVVLFLLGCSQDNSTEQTTQNNPTQTNPQEKTIQSSVSTQPTQTPVKSETNASSKTDVVLDANATVAKAKEDVKVAVETNASAVAKEAKSEVKKVQAAREKVETVKKVETAKKVEKASKPLASAVDGAAVYKTCVACHGQNAEKKALNKSQIIKGWESKKIVAALKGYKDGTYGGAMKAMMKGQVSKLSDAEIEAVAKHISKL